MTKKLIALFSIFAVLGLAACNTVQGVGKDISKAGDAIEDSAKKK